MKFIIRIFRNNYLKIKNYKITDEDYARSIGVKIGKNCNIRTRSWGREPYLISIGDHVHITRGVSFATHDGGVWVFREEIPDFDVFGSIKIDDNTYIGQDTKILPGVSIGKNCVIGSCSVVTKKIPDNTVAAGNPARFISSTDEYKEKMSGLNLRTKRMNNSDKKKAILNIPDEKLIKKAWLKTDSGK